MSEQLEQREVFTATLNAVTPRAFVTPAIIGLNVMVFVAMVIAGVDWSAPSIDHLMAWGADYWPATTHGQWWRLLTSAFLHVGLLHLALNMWALSASGVLVERLYGSGFYAAIYLFGAVTSSLTSIWWDPSTVGAGASGAIFAVYGAMLAYLLFQPKSFPPGAAQPLMKSTLGFVAFNVYYGLAHEGISNSAHLGGLTGGLLLGMAVCRPLALPRRARQAVPRAVAGAVIGLAAVCVGLYYLPKCRYDIVAEQAFLKERQSLGAAEKKAIDAFNSLLEQAQTGKLSDTDFAQQLDTQVIVPWDDMADRLAGIPLSDPSPSKPLRDALMLFYQTRRDASRALGEGLRTGEEHRVEEFKSLQDKADKMIGEIERLAKGVEQGGLRESQAAPVTTEGGPPTDGAGKVGPLLSGAETQTRADQLFEIYKATPTWTTSFDETFLREIADASGEALADVSPCDWGLYCNWIRTDPNPKCSQDGAMLIMQIGADKPDDYSLAKLDPALQSIYAVFLKAMPDFRKLIGDTTALSGTPDAFAAWSDEQLACFMAIQTAKTGGTAEKASHDMWMVSSLEGQRLMAALRQAVIR
jgi:rhomboid protease GluP